MSKRLKNEEYLCEIIFQFYKTKILRFFDRLQTVTNKLFFIKRVSYCNLRTRLCILIDCVLYLLYKMKSSHL